MPCLNTARRRIFPQAARVAARAVAERKAKQLELTLKAAEAEAAAGSETAAAAAGRAEGAEAKTERLEECVGPSGPKPLGPRYVLFPVPG